VKHIKYALSKGRNVIPIGVKESGDEILAGVIDYEVVVVPVDPDDDHINENNAAYGFTRLHGPPTILYVDGNIGYEENYHPLMQQALARELKLIAKERGADEETASRVKLHWRTVEQIPEEDLLVGYDCIILDNVPAYALGAARMEKIRSLVNDQGVGLVMIGGEQSFGPGNYLRTPIEEALPVDMDLKHKKVYPNGALAIILHTCEFPSGNVWAKKITKKSIDTLGAHDHIGVLYWDWQSIGPNGNYKWLFKMQPASDRLKLKKLVDGCEPGDMPDFDQTIKMAVTGLKSVTAAVRHIIVISDGDPGPPSTEVENQILNDKTITLSAISIGSHSTPVTLQRLATRIGGGRFYDVKNPSKLPNIFIKESMVVRRSLLFEEPFTPVFVSNANQDFVTDINHSGVPTLYGYVATTAKEAADVPLISPNENKDPIFAHWRYGLGQSVAWTSDTKNRWGKDWIGWNKFGKFWGGVIWKILREQPANLKLSTQIEGERGQIVVHALDKDGNPLSDMELVAYVSDPDSESLDPVRLRQTGVCTYEGDFPAGKVGKYQVTVRKREGSSGPDAAAYGGASVPFSAEMEKLNENQPLLRRISEKGGGAYLDPATRKDYDIFNRKDLPATKDFQDIWKLFLILAAVLFPLDVFVRRVMIDYSEVFANLRNRYRKLRGRPVEDKKRMDRLMSAKKKAIPQRPRAEFIEKINAAPKDFLFTREASEETGKTESKTPAKQEEKKAPVKEELPPETQEDNYTSRLLKAKLRAKGKKREE
ncbi:MAG: VWA domain-containing protein, partial [Planctomycetes bacterium]|nr:VWA domain-containing protein [Planctomycetota bacterium]